MTTTTPIPQETNRELELARHIIENTGANLFLTGRAGTGKTTFLKQLRETSSKRMVVVAPTGIAAINAGGVTIHSFFQLDFGPYIPGAVRKKNQVERFNRQKLKMIRGIDVLIIDEISMVRSDMLDQIDDVLRRKRDRHRPFGGVQLLMIGDPLQLPPVVVESERELLAQHYASPWFFDSPALKKAGYITIELQHVYRQRNGRFLDLLNAIRDNHCTPEIIAELNRRYNPSFVPPKDVPYVRLTTHNATARDINQHEMDKLKTPAYSFAAEVKGNFPESAYPADSDLILKKGAQVMFIKNDSSGERNYYNGMLGEISEISDTHIIVRASDSGNEISVKTEQWSNNRYEINEETSEITEVVDGIFEQYPLRPAWAITIHKSQGLTFSHAIIDAANSFAHGQTYVALSRCKSLEGLVLSAPISAEAVICDSRVVGFLRNNATPSAEILTTLEHRYYIELLTELFSFDNIDDLFFIYSNLTTEYFAKSRPEVGEALAAMGSDFISNIRTVAARFTPVFYNMALGSDYAFNSALKERVASGAAYFVKVLEIMCNSLDEIPTDISNKQTKKRILDVRQHLRDNINVKIATLNQVIDNGFAPSTYLATKGDATLGTDKTKRKEDKKPSNKPKAVDDIVIENQDAYVALVEWRAAEARRISVPAYTLATNKALAGIANMMPTTVEELHEVAYLSKNTINRYGDTIIDIITTINK